MFVNEKLIRLNKYFAGTELYSCIFNLYAFLDDNRREISVWCIQGKEFYPLFSKGNYYTGGKRRL